MATSDSPTVEEFLYSWLASKRRTNQIKPRTADGYDDNIRNYIVPGIGRIQLSLLTAWDVQRWLDWELDRGLGVATVRAAWRTLSSALSRARQLRMVTENCAAGGLIQLPSHKQIPARHLEPDEIARFQEVLVRQAAEGASHFECAEATLLFVALTTGMRNEEVLGLAWDDVSLDDDGTSGRIHVCRVLQRVRDYDALPKVHTNGRVIRPKKLIVGTPKSAAGDRWIDLFPDAVAMLRAERDRQRIAKWSPLPEGDLVFRTRFQKPLSDVYLNQRMKRACLAAGIAYRSFYGLRHTAASVGVHVGENSVSLAQFLGHSDPATTNRIYARVFDEHKLNRMEKMQAFMQRSSEDLVDER